MRKIRKRGRKTSLREVITAPDKTKAEINEESNILVVGSQINRRERKKKRKKGRENE